MAVHRSRIRPGSAALLCLLAAGLGAASFLAGTCGPFTDTASDTFCPFVLEIFTLGITTGTSPTTFEPGSFVTRLQMAAFLSRTVDAALKRGGRRASLNQFSTPQNLAALGLVTVGMLPRMVRSDGADVWVAVQGGAGSVARVRASDGKLLETWTGTSDPYGIVIARGRVIVAGSQSPGLLYTFDPSQPAGAATLVASNLGADPGSIAFDGARIWTANQGIPGSVSIVTPGATIPWTVTTVTAGFSQAFGAVFDGTNVWIADSGPRLFRLDASGSILQTVTIAAFPGFPVFDGTNIWVPEISSQIEVVRASSGAILQTLTGNGLGASTGSAFDGQRVLVTSVGSRTLSLWKAADLTPLGNLSTGGVTNPFGACSDGVNFWIALQGAAAIARF